MITEAEQRVLARIGEVTREKAFHRIVTTIVRIWVLDGDDVSNAVAELLHRGLIIWVQPKSTRSSELRISPFFLERVLEYEEWP